MAQVLDIESHPPRDSEITSATSPTQVSGPTDEGTQRQTKRPTSSFPVLLPTIQGHIDHQNSISPKYSSPAESARSSPRLVPQSASPTDPNNFLTTLAAQERRVLELREELQKAEGDLAALKKQWAVFEANQKKSGMRHVEQLQPLSAASLSKTDSGGDVPTPLNVSTFEKLAAKPPRKPQQRVFSSSRHTRTLSLLTPVSRDSNNPYAEALRDDNTQPAADPEHTTKDPTLSRSPTVPSSETNAGFGKTYKNLANRRSMPPPSADALVKTGKQMASDLRDGLWTFFEDIRQATVGEEAINGPDTQNHSTSGRPKLAPKSSNANGAPRKKRSNTTLGHSSRNPLHHDAKTDADHHANNRPEESFWKEFGVDTPGHDRPLVRKSPPGRREHEAAAPPPPPPQQQQREALLVDVDDDWDAWESPVSQQKTSPRRTGGGAQVNNESNTGSGGALPWPVLTKLTPSKLTRTVSDLMRDWDSPYPNQTRSHSNISEHVMTSPHV